MKFISLLEFQTLVGLSDRALINLLAHNLVPCEYRPESGIFVDIEAVTQSSLNSAMLATTSDSLKRHRDLVAEKLGNIIRDEIDTIVDDAIGRYLSEKSENE